MHSLLLTHGTVATATAEGLGHPALTPTPLRRCSVRSCLREEELVEGGAHRAPPPGLTWCRVPPTATPTGPADRVSCASPAPVGPQGAGRRPLPELAAHLAAHLALGRSPLLPLTFLRLCK